MKKKNLVFALTLFASVSLFGCGKKDDKPNIPIYYDVNLVSKSLKLIGKGITQAWNNYSAQLVVKDDNIFTLPSTIDIVVGGQHLDNQKYTYDNTSGMINIDKAGSIGNLYIVAEGGRIANKHIITTTASSFGSAFVLNSNQISDHLVYDESETSAGLKFTIQTINSDVFSFYGESEKERFKIKNEQTDMDITESCSFNFKSSNEIEITIPNSYCKNDFVLEAPMKEIKKTYLKYDREDEPVTEEVAKKVTFNIKKESSNTDIKLDWGDGSAIETITSDSTVSHTFNANITESLITIDGSARAISDFSERDITNCINNITAVGFSGEIKEISKNSFSNFRFLKSAIFVEANASIETFEKQAFFSNYHLEFINIPKSLNEIKEEAFANCKALNEVRIPENANLYVIGSGAFQSCSNDISLTGLKTIAFPARENNKDLIIGEKAFMNCNKLESVSIKDTTNFTHIGKRAFAYCSNLEKIEGLKLKDDENNRGLDDYAFAYCASLQSCPIDSNSQFDIIGAGAFAYCNSLQSFELPHSVKKIFNSNDEILEIGAFQGCTALGAFEMKNSQLEEIGACSFMGCASLMTFIIQSSNIEAIGSYAFKDCVSLETLDLSEARKKIDYSEEMLPPPSKPNGNLRHIYVSELTIQEYKTDHYWGEYQNIIEIKR